ncbi:FAD dependent oxidoreductase [Mobilisporobacter senegalensis]|uniref:FAD dependent oxidoreductase n=1 Tax=Mobilisporobacter senegalensis TaxID=1329262 RepID=A0A3N1Y1Q2_9FIRM|nr:FAD-dependent oxidoreductase [Mobilisporobacter senegalensis]ROR31452.1 FAD dependent oxidoreductase [Mobilisporobacter senegalensis]
MDYKEEYDVIVAGGGPAGIGAAVSASRNGRKVLLIERAGFLGGMATNGSVPAFCPYTDGERPIVGGIGLEVLNCMKKESYVSPFYDHKEGRIKEYDWVPIDPEVLKRVSDQIVLESKCNILLHSLVTDVIVEAGKIKAVNVHNKGGNYCIRAKYFIDCTGDADLVAMAGGSFEYGDEEGLVQAGTLCFRISNFDTDRFMIYARESGEDGNLNVAVKKAKENNDFPKDERYVAGIALQADGMAGLNFGHVYHFNPLDGKDLTRAEMEARARLPEFMNFLRKYVPGAEKAVLASSGPVIGLRESRRIVGDYKLTKEDYYNRADFEDTIARYSYPIDIHAATPKEDDYSTNREYVTSKYKIGEAYSIPYRALLPVGFHNLLVAGRTISTDRAMLGSVRVMPACFATGEAAGTAAALCCKKKLTFRQIPGKELQEMLIKQGGILS